MASMRENTGRITIFTMFVIGAGLAGAALARWSTSSTNAYPEYVSPTGFKPIRYHQRGPRESYVMLDMIPEPEGYVRWINKQTILPGNEHGLMISYQHARSNCANSMMQIIGEGDTIERMAVNRPTGMFHLVEGSSAYESTAVACRERSYANSGGAGRVY